MSAIFRFTGMMLLFALGALPLAGCDTAPWDSGMVLVLKVDTPKEGATVTTPTVKVSGRVTGTESKNAKVSINGADAPVVDSKYAADVPLVEGKNVINLVASAGQANPSQQVTVNYAPAKTTVP